MPRTAIDTPAVVVGIDDQTGCAAAVAWAAEEARSRGVSLKLVHVWSWGVLNPDLPEVAHRARAEVISCLAPQFERFTRLAKQRGATVSSDVLEGFPAAGLAETEADLVVVGSHHLHGAGRAVMGSVSSALASRASVPIVVVLGLNEPVGPDGAVVIGLSGSLDDARLVQFGFDYAERHQLGVRAVMCWDPPLGNHRLPPPKRLEVFLDHFVLDWAAHYPGVATQTTVVRGGPVEALVEASTGEALLVVGKRRQRLRLGSVLGSTSLGVLRHAACPVAVLPPAINPYLPARDAGSNHVEHSGCGEDRSLTEDIMSSIELTPSEVRLVKNALRAFLTDFGHDEADVVESIRAVIAKLPQADPAD